MEELTKKDCLTLAAMYGAEAQAVAMWKVTAEKCQKEYNKLCKQMTVVSLIYMVGSWAVYSLYKDKDKELKELKEKHNIE